ncbi:MAG: hypothetical protein ACP5J6_11340 [Candidatus Saccharicenans sp.]
MRGLIQKMTGPKYQSSILGQAIFVVLLLLTAGLIFSSGSDAPDSERLRSRLPSSTGLAQNQNQQINAGQPNSHQSKPEQVQPAKPEPALRPIEIKDILAWKSISYSRVSDDGRCFVYVLAPNEGDS